MSAPSPAKPHDYARWEPEIAAFERADQVNPPPKGGILFVGSSTIRLWKTLAEDFPGLPIIRRGFGGSEVVDCTYFAGRIIFPYAPKMIFLRTGGNAIAAGKSAVQVREEFREFVGVVQGRLPEAEILFISLSASIARLTFAEENRVTSRLIQEYCAGLPRVTFIDAYDVPLGADGKPRPELFAADMLHYNADGYRLLAERVRPYLPKVA